MIDSNTNGGEDGMTLRKKEGIPGCWGKSGVYYAEGTPGKYIREIEELFAEFDRKLRRENIIFAVTVTTLFLITVAAVAALLWLYPTGVEQ